MKWPVILTFIFLICSCGEGGKGSFTNYKKAYVGSSFILSSSFSNDEKSIGERVCLSYRSKRIQFSSLQQTKKLTAKISQKSCGRSVATSSYSGDLQIKQLLSSGPIYLDGSFPVSYYSIMQTDREGELKKLCQSILNSETPKKVIQENDRVTLFQLMTKKDSGIDVVRLIKGPKSSDDLSVLADEIIEFNVYTNGQEFTSGLVVEILKRKACSDFPGEQDLLRQVIEQEN